MQVPFFLVKWRLILFLGLFWEQPGTGTEGPGNNMSGPSVPPRVEFHDDLDQKVKVVI